MTKQTASKKKAVKTSNAQAKAKEAQPAASQPEEATTNSAKEQAETKPETKGDNKPEDSKPEEKPKGKKTAKKRRGKPAGKGKKEEEKPAVEAGAKEDAERSPTPEAEDKKSAGTARDAADEARPAKKPRRKAKAKKAAAPAAEPKEEPEVKEKAITKASKKKPGKKKPTQPKQERKPGVQRVVVASGNPAKIQAAELGFARMFPDKAFSFEGVSVESGVADQPMTDDETFAGALNRAMSSREEQPEADFWIGLEGGLQEEGDDFFAFAWIVILGPEGLQGKSRTGTFAIPPAVTELVRSGKELGEADDIVFEQTNSKQSSGAIGILTHGVLDRAHYYAEAVLMALIPFKNPALYLMQEEVEEEV